MDSFSRTSWNRAHAMATASVHGKPGKLTSEQTAAVKNELDAILNSDYFSSTKRSSDFLEFVVKGALAGDCENLTERSIGAVLFGRPIDYETGTDAIVRVRANDVRHRLASFYSEHHPDSRVSIYLPPGSYIPEFHWSESGEPKTPTNARDAGASLNLETVEGSSAAIEIRNQTVRTKLTKSVLTAAVLLLSVVAGVIIFWRATTHRDRTLREFWQPLIRDHGRVIVCFGNATSFWPSESVRQALEKGDRALLENPGRITVTRDDTVTVGNLRAAVSISNLLSGYGIANELRWPQEVQSEDLNRSNAIFIGGLNNPWSMSLNEGLRYSMKQVQTENGPVWTIQDRRSPNQDWSITAPYPEASSVDYALITRVIDRERGRVVISVGGLGQFGTQAAGEFLTDESALSAFERTAPSGWEHRNLQIVLGMRIDGRKIVSPRILATNVW